MYTQSKTIINNLIFDEPQFYFIMWLKFYNSITIGRYCQPKTFVVKFQKVTSKNMTMEVIITNRKFVSTMVCKNRCFVNFWFFTSLLSYTQMI